MKINRRSRSRRTPCTRARSSLWLVARIRKRCVLALSAFNKLRPLNSPERYFRSPCQHLSSASRWHVSSVTRCVSESSRAHRAWWPRISWCWSATERAAGTRRTASAAGSTPIWAKPEPRRPRGAARPWKVSGVSCVCVGPAEISSSCYYYCQNNAVSVDIVLLFLVYSLAAVMQEM